MSARSAIHSGEQQTAPRLAKSLGNGHSNAEVKSTFQDFVAGAFYKQMLKSLHKMHGKPAYLYGGRAEEIFQGQMDQELSENLAKSHGSQFAEPLFQSFVTRRAGHSK